MNKHMKLLFAALFVVIIVLAAAIARFYSHTDKNVYDGGAQSAIAQKLGTNSNGDLIFQDSNGLYGVADSSERVIVSPEWDDLSFTDSSFCIAKKHVHGSLLCGCIDYEGNVIVPLIYDSIEKKQINGFSFYTAVSHTDGSYVLYSADFSPLFTRSWKNCEYDEETLTLHTDKGSFLYTVTPMGLAMKNAKLYGSAVKHDFELDITSKLLLSKLTVPMIEDMTAAAGKYLEYAFSGDEKYLSDIKTAENPVFTTLFPDEERIKSRKLTGVPDIFLYSTRSEDDVPHFSVSVTAETDLVYTDDNNKNAHMDGKYTAVIEFSGSSAGELKAISGGFRETAPEYPAPEPEHPSISENSDTESGYITGNTDGTALPSVPDTTVRRRQKIYIKGEHENV